MYARINIPQECLLKQYVEGKNVLDLGGGDGQLAELCLKLGAKGVELVDLQSPRNTLDPRIKMHIDYMQNGIIQRLGNKIDIVILSWPCNYSFLNRIPQQLPKKPLIYLGINHDGTACGTTEFWKQIVENKVLDFSCDRATNMIVYGIGQRREGCLLHEEYNGLTLDTGPIAEYKPGVSKHKFDRVNAVRDLSIDT